MDKTRLDLGELVTSTADEMKLLAEDKSIRLRIQAVPGINVEGDRTRLQQVIVNLIDHAIKYTQGGGRVEVRVGRAGNAAVLEVSDDGPGIPAHAVPHVFERFYRADKARSRASGGAGLGLSIVKSICAAHSAEVIVSTQECAGACVRLELPLRPLSARHGTPLA